MAVSINVYDSLVLTDAASSYEVGAGIDSISATVISKELEVNADNIPFFVNANIGGSIGVYTIKAAPGVGKYIAITQITVMSADKNVVRIGWGTGAGWIDNIIIGPLVFNTEASGVGYKVGTQYTLTLKQPIRLPANTALTADISATGYVLVTAEGVEY